VIPWRLVALYVGLGAFFWLVAALFIHWTGPELWRAGNPWLAFVFLACIPIGWIFIGVTLVLGGISRREALVPVSLMCVTGLLLDGIAISTFPSLYGASAEHVMLGAAWLLWGVGVLLALVLFTDVRARI